MKYSIDTTQKETQAFLDLLMGIIDVAQKNEKRRFKLDKKRLDLDQKKLAFEKEKWRDIDEESEEDSEEDTEDEEWKRPEPILAFDAERAKKRKKKKKKLKEMRDVDPDIMVLSEATKVQKVRGVFTKKTAPIEVPYSSPPPIQTVGQWNEDNLSDHQKLGKKVLGEILDVWVINWGQEGQQPNRFELIHDISIDGKRGGAVVSYCMVVKGLSVAVHNVFAFLNPDVDPVHSRDIAANITQVSSCVFSPLADQFKYPNPLEKFITVQEIKNESI